jgi:hypothetical protein
MRSLQHRHQCHHSRVWHELVGAAFRRCPPLVPCLDRRPRHLCLPFLPSAALPVIIGAKRRCARRKWSDPGPVPFRVAVALSPTNARLRLPWAGLQLFGFHPATAQTGRFRPAVQCRAGRVPAGVRPTPVWQDLRRLEVQVSIRKSVRSDGVFDVGRSLRLRVLLRRRASRPAGQAIMRAAASQSSTWRPK